MGVALQGGGHQAMVNGHLMQVPGTSASTPTIAGMVGVLNDLRMSRGMPPLGFLNPLLYHESTRAAGVFNDITEGSNPGCGTQGFPASEGWDPATGLGSINFGNLKQLVL